ncbi:MAG TPA: hypothetical protein VEW42_00340 [Candidatus Eisenbacteria bacterium]|nr:hypothetical protein [Candidatus Eisenbacteria bacterium]
MITKYRLQFLAIFIYIIFWFFAAIFINPYSPFTIIVYKHSLSQQNDKANRTTGSFIAEENNLGIIAIRVVGEIKPNSTGRGLITFALREKNNSHSFYSTQTEVNQVNEKGFLVFGFPSITNSKGRQYEFVTTIPNASPNTLNVGDFFTSKYVYSKQFLYSPKDFLFLFFKRTRMLFSNPDSLVLSSIYLIPLFVYFLYVLNKRNGQKLDTTIQDTIQKIVRTIALIVYSRRKSSKKRISITKEDEKIPIFFEIKNKYVRAFGLHVLFFLFSIIILSPILLTTHVVRANDLNGNDVPHLYFKNSLLQHHAFPLWNPYVVQGIPTVADPLYGVYNPLVAIPLLVFPYDTALKIMYLLVIFFACESMYILTKRYLNSSYLSLFIALTYASSSYLAAKLDTGQIEKTLSYPLLPFVIFSLQKVIDKKNLFWSGVAGLEIALFLFSGETYTATYTLYGLGVILIFFLFKDKRASVYLGISVLFFLLFASVKIIPYLELTNYLEKSRDPFTGSMNIVGMLRYIFIPFDAPFAAVNLKQYISTAWGDLEKISFIGPFTLLGFVWVFLKRKIVLSRKYILLPILFLLFISISMPAWKWNPFHWLVSAVSFLQYYRVPSRIFAYLSVILLLFFGLFCRDFLSKRKILILVVLVLNLVVAIIFFETILIKPQLVTDQKIDTLNYPLYSDVFKWIQKDNANQSLVLVVNNIHLVPYDLAYQYNTLLLNTNYGLLLKNSLVSSYTHVSYPPPSTYHDILPGYVISPHNIVTSLPWDSTKAYVNEDTIIFKVHDARPFSQLITNKGEVIKKTIASFGVNTITIREGSDQPAILSLLESYYPGWSVTIDGKKAHLENNRFLEVKTRPGQHTYVFSFFSKTFLLGFFVTIFSLGGFLLWLGVTFFVKKSVFLAYL